MLKVEGFGRTRFFGRVGQLRTPSTSVTSPHVAGDFVVEREAARASRKS